MVKINVVLLSTLNSGQQVHGAYHRDHTAGPDAVAHSKHRHVISIVSPPKEILISHIMRLIIHHPASTVHSARVTTAHIGGEISTVSSTVVGATLEILFLIKGDLKIQKFIS